MGVHPTSLVATVQQQLCSPVYGHDLTLATVLPRLVAAHPRYYKSALPTCPHSTAATNSVLHPSDRGPQRASEMLPHNGTALLADV
jgi:hypothetical protein